MGLYDSPNDHKQLHRSPNSQLIQTSTKLCLLILLILLLEASNSSDTSYSHRERSVNTEGLRRYNTLKRGTWLRGIKQNRTIMT